MSRILLIALAFTLVATAARAQTTCNTSTPIERLYVELNVRGLLESEQLWGDFGVRSGIPLTKAPSGGRWFIDFWRDDTPIGLTPAPLDNLTFKPTKPGWAFARRMERQVRAEMLDGGSRCAAIVLFDAVRVWRARVVAEPQGEAAPVKIECRECAAGSTTDYLTNPAPAGSPIPMTADFGPECKVQLNITDDRPTRTFSVGNLYQLLPDSCLGFYRVAARRPKIPRGGISVQIVSQ